MDLEALAASAFRRALQDPEARKLLVGILAEALGGVVGPQLAGAVGALSLGPQQPERWLKTAQMAARVRRSPEAFRALYERCPDLRALADPPETAEGTRPHLRWPEQQTVEWFRVRRPEMEIEQ